MDDEESESVADPAPTRSKRGERPHVWGIWKKQVIDVGGETAQERDRRAQAMLEEHQGLIRVFMRRTPLPKNTVFSEDDLFRVYQVVLLQAASCYDPAKAAFSTWVARWLRQAYIDIARRARGLSRREQDLYLKQRARERWEASKAAGRDPGPEPTPLDSDDVTDLEHAFTRRVVSMHVVGADGPFRGTAFQRENADSGAAGLGGAALEELCGFYDDHEILVARQKREWLYKKLSNGVLNPREKDVMDRLLDGWSTREIATERGCARQYIDAIRKEAVRKLRIAAVAEGFTDEAD